MKNWRYGWPFYLALLIGVTAIFELLFEFAGLSDATVGGILLFAALTIMWDFFSGETPSQQRREVDR